MQYFINHFAGFLLLAIGILWFGAALYHFRKNKH